MITCPNCGSQNENVARFCGECGADLRSLRATSPATANQPAPNPAPAFGASPGQFQSDWQSTQSLPETPKKGRRVWLWIVIGVLGLCLALCCGFGIWANQGGEETLNGWLTQLSDELTEVAPTETPFR